MTERDVFWKTEEEELWRLAQGTPPFTIEGIEPGRVYLVKDGTGETYRLTADAEVVWNIVDDFGAVGDGVTNNTAAFEAFNTAAVAETNAVKLIIPEGTYVAGGTWMRNIPDLTIEGVGEAILKPIPFVGTTNGVRQNAFYSVRAEGIAEGATTFRVKDIDPARFGLSWDAEEPDRSLSELTELFEPGGWVMVAAYDTMGFFYPPNPQFHEFRQIASISENIITLTEPLANEYYRDTFPHYWNGARIRSRLALNSGSMSGTFEVGQTLTQGSVTATITGVGSNYLDLTDFTGVFAAFAGVSSPTASATTTFKAGHWETFEVDKGGPVTVYAMNPAWDSEVHLKNLIFRTGPGGIPCSARKITFEDCDTAHTGHWPSMSKDFRLIRCNLGFVEVDKLQDRLEIDGCTATTIKCQTADPRDLIIQNSTFTRLDGTARRTVITNCTMTTELKIGPTAYGVSESLTIENSAIASYPSGYGRNVSLSGVTIDGGTLRGDSTFGREWAVPGSILLFNQSDGTVLYTATVTDFIRDGDENVIITDKDGFPTYSLEPTRVAPSPCGSITVTNCSGSVWAEMMSRAPDGLPWGSCWTGWLGDDGLIKGGGWAIGKLVSYKVNVTTAYTGAKSTLTLTPAQFGCRVVRLGTGEADAAVRFNPAVNLKITGERIYTPEGRTGIQSGDNYSEDGNVWFIRDGAPRLSAAISSEDPSVWPEFTVELITDQYWKR